MTKPTTADCIEWLDQQIANRERSAAVCVNDISELELCFYRDIRAQLIAAKEMYEAIRKMNDNEGVSAWMMLAMIKYREAGGE